MISVCGVYNIRRNAFPNIKTMSIMDGFYCGGVDACFSLNDYNYIRIQTSRNTSHMSG